MILGKFIGVPFLTTSSVVAGRIIYNLLAEVEENIINEDAILKVVKKTSEPQSAIYIPSESSNDIVISGVFLAGLVGVLTGTLILKVKNWYFSEKETIREETSEKKENLE